MRNGFVAGKKPKTKYGKRAAYKKKEKEICSLDRETRANESQKKRNQKVQRQCVCGLVLQLQEIKGVSDKSL